MPLEALKRQLQLVERFQRDIMVKGQDYDTIPGTKKPSLMNPGAEKLALLFNLGPRYEPTFTHHERHLTVVTKTFLWHRTTGVLWGEGLGSCSSKESKYAYRKAERSCPGCGKTEPGLKKSKQHDEWYCWAKVGGCGATFGLNDPRVTGQEVGRIPNPDIEDTHNTVLKMSMKRSFVGAIRTATAAGHLFTQDLVDEERYDGDGPAGGEGDGAQFADPRPFYEQIDQAADIGQLQATGNAIAETQLHPQDRDELAAAYLDKLKKLKAAGGVNQRAVMDDVARSFGQSK